MKTEKSELNNTGDMRRRQAEDALSKYSDQYNFAPIGLFTIDMQGLIQEVNLLGASLLGVKRRNLMNRPFQQFVAPKDRPSFDEFCKSAFETSTKQTCDLKLLRDGKPAVYARIDGIAAEDDSLNGRQCRIAVIDMTERNQSEEALQVSEDRYSRLFETMNEGFILAEVVTDDQGKPIDYRFLDVNSAGERFFGRSREEIVGHTYKTIGGANADPEWIDVLCRVALTGEAVSIDRYAPVGGHWVHLLAYSPRARQFAAIFDDITERKRAEIALQEANEEQEVITEELRQQNDELASVQSALRESEERYRDLVENANSIIIKMDRAGKITFFNDYAQKFFGYSLEEILGQNVMILIPPIASNGSNLEEMADSILENPDGFAENINENVRKNGERVWISWRNKAIRDARGEIIGNLTVGQDITERKRAEEALLKNEARFMALVQNLNSGVALIDEMGKFTIVNPAFLKMFGLSEDQSDIKNVNDQNWSEWQVFEEDGSLLNVDDHPVRKAAMTGKPVRNKLVGVKLPSGGELTWMLISAEPILKPDGQIDLLICTYHDITERKRAETDLQEANEELQVATEELRRQNDELMRAQSKLRESEENYRTIVETANEGIWVVDPETRTTYVNRRMAEMLGCGPEEMIGMNSSEFMDEEGKARLGLLLERRRQGINESFEIKFLRKNGSALWTISSAAPLRDKEGNFVGSLGMLTDITERKQVEK